MLSRTARAVLIIAALGGWTLATQAGIESPFDVPGVTDKTEDLFGPSTSTYTPIGNETKNSSILSDADLAGSFGNAVPTMVMAAPPPPPPRIVVPEPASLAVLALGAAALLIRRRR